MTAANKASSLRKRSKNYLPEEELLLLDLVEEHKNCIENKKSGAVIWKEKEEAWRNIADEFAAASGIHRHWKALREKYDSIKRKSKGELSDQKLERFHTDDGPTRVTNEPTETISMAEDSSTVLRNVYDSDSRVSNCMEIESSIESFAQKDVTNEKSGSTSNSMREKYYFSSWRPSSSKEPRSNELVAGVKRKRNVEEERLELIILQQNFYRDENTRAQEKHELELQSLEYKNELLKLELEEKISKTATISNQLLEQNMSEFTESVEVKSEF